MNNIKTLTGLTLEQAIKNLDEQLPDNAYSAVPGGANLTDIDPNYMRKTLNEVFGLCGYGWGYEYDPGDMEIRSETRKGQNGTREVVLAALKHLRLWYKLVDAGGETITCTVDASGGSDNSNASYSMKGAITNAIGNAVSNIGFQESVYLGKRSHQTVRPGKRAAAPPPARKPVAAPQKAAPVNDGEISDAEEPAGTIDPAAMPLDEVLAFVIPTGAWKGKTIQEAVDAGDRGRQAIEFWTRLMPGADPDKKALKAAALRFVALEKSNHKVAQPA